MRTILRAGTILAFCGAMAACSHTPPPPPPPVAEAAPAPAPTPPTTFDGVYRGMLTRVRSTGRACARSHSITMRITNGSFSYTGGRMMRFTGTLMPDGSLTATSGDTTLKGQAADTMLTGTLDGEKCGYTFSLKKRG